MQETPSSGRKKSGGRKWRIKFPFRKKTTAKRKESQHVEEHGTYICG